MSASILFSGNNWVGRWASGKLSIVTFSGCLLTLGTKSLKFRLHGLDSFDTFGFF